MRKVFISILVEILPNVRKKVFVLKLDMFWHTLCHFQEKQVEFQNKNFLRIFESIFIICASRHLWKSILVEFLFLLVQFQSPCMQLSFLIAPRFYHGQLYIFS